MKDPREVLNVAGSLIGVAMVSLLGFALWALFYLEVPSPNKDVLLVVIGILSTKVGTVVDFFYGSSSTTKKQAETIDTLAKTAQTAGVALGAPAGAMVIPEGESAKATSTPAGTVIEREP